MSSEEILNKHIEYLNNEFETIKNILLTKEDQVNKITTKIDTESLIGEK